MATDDVRIFFNLAQTQGVSVSATRHDASVDEGVTETQLLPPGLMVVME